jgi:hypothetical protein
MAWVGSPHKRDGQMPVRLEQKRLPEDCRPGYASFRRMDGRNYLAAIP